MNEASNIQNSTEQAVNYTDLLSAVNSVLFEHPEYLTKKGAYGKCVDASTQLLFKLDEMYDFPINGYVDGDKRPHHWAVVENWCIDLTARQFNETDECPKIWLNSR